MNSFSEDSLNYVSPETTKTFHDLAVIWLQANITAAGLSPEELLIEYRKVFDRIVAADTAEQKLPGSSRRQITDCLPR